MYDLPPVIMDNTPVKGAPNTHTTSFNPIGIYGGASRLLTESVKMTLVSLWEIGISWEIAESRIWISWVWVHWLEFIDLKVAEGKLPCADINSQAKDHWFEQNRKWQPLVVQVRRLPSLRKGDSLKVGQTTIRPWVPVKNSGRLENRN